MTKTKEALRRVLAAGVLALPALGGCFSPDFGAAECVACPDDVCPGNLVCQDHFCVSPGSRIVCQAQIGEVSTGGTAGTSGSGNLPGGGSPGEGGAAGDPGGGEMRIEAVIASPACTGRELEVELSAEHGQAPYTWSLVGEAGALTLSITSSGAALSGTFESAGDYSVNVSLSDANGTVVTRELTLVVHETPVVDTTTLGSVCPDEMYSAELEAHGGEGDYVWSSNVPESTGLAVDGSLLRGHFASETGEADSIEVTLGVESDGCSSDPVTVTLIKNAAEDCPQIQAMSLPVPPPCAGNPYELGFGITGGVGPFTWSLVAAPAGLALDDPEEPIVSGSPEEGGTVAVEVTDADSGRTFRTDVTLEEPRDSCWLGYLAPATGDTRFHLLDPLLGNEHEFPDDAGAEPVTDFKFSPDGRFAAYRRGDSTAEGALVLVQMSTLEEQEFSSEGVTRYAFSDDSSFLAVAFDTNSDRKLGGFRLTTMASSPPSYPELTAVFAEVDTELRWFAGPNLLYMSYFNDVSRVPVTATLGPASFAPWVHGDGNADNDAHFVPSATGVYVVPSNGFVAFHYAVGEKNGVPHRDVLMGPGGHFVARSESEELAVYFAANQSGGLDPVATSTHAGCDAVLGWAPGLDRVLCGRPKDSDETEGELAAFDIEPTTGDISDPIVISDSKALPPTGATGLARLFTPSGTRLAYVQDDRVSAVRVISGGGSFVDFEHQFLTLPDRQDAVLDFSPSERFLVVHRGPVLSLYDFDGLHTNEWLLTAYAGEGLPLAPACDEDFDAAEGTYCGGARKGKRFAWSPDSTLIALGTESGVLIVEDLRQLDAIPEPMHATDACGADCNEGERFAFQP